MFFGTEDSGALNAPDVNPESFHNPLLITTAAAYLATLAGKRLGAGKYIAENIGKYIDTTKVAGEVGNAAKVVQNAWREAQISAMVGVSKTTNPAQLNRVARGIGDHDDLGLFNALDEVLVTRSRLKGMAPGDQADELINQVDAQARSIIREQFEAVSRGNYNSMTVDDILNMDPSEAVKMFGEKSLNLVKEGLDQGLIEGATSLGKGVFKGADGGVLRTDLATVGTVAKAVKAAANEFHIPFLGVKFGDLFGAPIQHLAGRRNTMRLVQGHDDPSKVSLLVGKKLFDIEQGANANAGEMLGLKFVDDNMNFGVGSIGQGVFGRRGQLPSQAPRVGVMGRVPKSREEPIKAAAGAVSEGLFGVSRTHQTSHSLWERIKLSYKRRMDGTLEHDPLVRTSQTGPKGNMEEALNETLGGTAGPGQVHNAVEPNPNIDKMGLFDKIKSTLGWEVKNARYLDDAGEEIVGRKLVASTPAPAPSPALSGENVLKDGVRQARSAVDSFVYKDEMGSKLQDLVHFGVNRLNDLFGWTFGVGLVPTKSTALAVTRASFAFTGITTAATAVSYADYLTGRAISAATMGAVDEDDARPSSMVMDAYAGARSLLQDVREVTGISSVARGAERAAPGIIDSDLSNVARWTAGPLAGMIAKSRVGFAAGAAASVLLGDDFTGSITDTPGDVRDVLSGEKEVAIRKGRYWEFGKQAYSGGQIGYFNQGIVARMRSRYKDTSTLYGSAEERWGNESWLPTPTNLFGIRKMIEGSKLESRHILSRPYPGRSPGATDRALDSHYGEKGGGDQKIAAVQGDFLANRRGSLELGINMVSGSGYSGEYTKELLEGMAPVKSMLTQSMMNTADKYTEQFGIYRWMAETVGKMGFGSEHVSSELADSDFMASTSRSYYDEQLGGLFTLSELPRRFMPSGQVRRQRQAYNPLPNLMPHWVPGSRAQDMRDQEYPINFHTGDAYGKIKHGEMRLPGEAYERLHRLHSGAPGVYDAMDRFLMLSDIAPGSESHKHYKAIVTGWSKSGALDKYWEKKFNSANDQAEAKLRVHNFKQKPRNAIMGAGPEEEGFNIAQMTTGFLWEGLTREVIPRVGASVPLLGNFLEDKLLATRDAQETYLNREIYDTDEYDWAKPYETMIRPMVDGLVASDPVTATAGGGLSAFLFAANPASRAVAAVAGALFVGGASAKRAITTGSIENGYIPDHVQERREVDAYFDNIEYMKYKRLEQGAQSMRNMEAAEKYRDLASRTVAGIDYNLGLEQFKRAAMKALPARERAYMTEFFNVDESKRMDVLAYLPDHIKPIYEAAFAKQGDRRFQGRLSQLTSTSSEDRVIQYLDSTRRSAPDRDWAGWNPNVDWDAIRYETSMAMGNSVAGDIHRQGLTFTRWDPTVMGQVASYDLDITEHFQGSAGLNPAQMFSLESELRSAGMSDIYIDNGVTAGHDTMSYDFRDSRAADIRASFGRY